MPPPNFARKKRKSHSRGTSARRTRHRNNAEGKSDHRSSSVDVTSISSTSKERSDDSKLVNSSQLKEAAQLSDTPQGTKNLQTSVIQKENNSEINLESTEESLQKKSPFKKRTNKKASKKNIDSCENLHKSVISGNSSNIVIESVNTSLPINMVQEDNLDKLSKLLERLDATYKVDSCQSSTSQGKSISQLNGNFNKTSSFTPLKGKPEENHSSKENPTEETLSQEEKQALRKARKEAKKGGKSVAAACKPSSNSVDSAVQVSQGSKSVPKQTFNSVNSAVPVSQAIKSVSKPTSDSVDSAISNSQASKEIEAVLTNNVKSEKSKAELKRERREKQEAQRAAKLATKAENEIAVQKSDPIQKKLSGSVKVPASPKIVSSKKKKVLKSQRRLPLFEHLSVPKIDDDLSNFNEARIHPAIRTAGICMKDMKSDGSLARVISTLSAVYSLIEDYRTPPSCDLSRALSDHLSSNIAFLNACRPLPEPVNNVIRFVKKEINEIGNSVPESQAKETLLSSIDSFIHQNITLASKTLVQNALDFIEDNDVILTFGMSHLVKEAISEASKLKDNLCVVVADSPGIGSGLLFVKLLSDLKIKVYYRMLSDLSQIMKRVSKVIVEAEAVVLNGAVIGHCGMAGLILQSKFNCVPVIVLSHTIKFCNIDLTDSLVVNELGDPSVIVNRPSPTYRKYLENWEEIPNLNVVNLMYDVTPPDLINVLVTERGNYPTSVVPVIIRRNFADILGHD